MQANVLVTGSNGQLGNSIRRMGRSWPEYRFFFTDIEELDITKADDVKQFVDEHEISCIINAAAYTAVDKAEEEPEKANLINAGAVGILAACMKEANGLLIHISTDYVFNGEAHRPINEDDEPDPVSAYARSKWLGEQQIAETAPNAVIIRTSWLYSEYGNNFVKTMIRLGRERDELKVVCDQVGTPTYAGDLAGVILQLLPVWMKGASVSIYHYSNEGVAGWYDFALSVHEFASIRCRVIPIETKDYPLPAKRPFYSLMSKAKIKKQFGIVIPHWRESLKICVENLLKAEREN